MMRARPTGENARMPTTTRSAGDLCQVADPVRRWRVEQLEAAGYASYDAHVLSERAEVDLHRAIDLLRAGCPPQTALRILL
jgi:hypothetical protein